MLCYFPQPYKGELLYSIVARVDIRSGNIFFRTTTRELFGNPRFIASVDPPCHIDYLVRNLPFYNQLTKKDLIINHTLYPFYTAFLPAIRAKSVYKTMGKPYRGNIYIKTGITVSSVHIFPFFQFCPDCCREDLLNHGEYYWHRIQNTPGVLICPDHKKVLHYSSFRIHPDQKNEFSEASPDNYPDNTQNVLFGDKIIEKLDGLAADIQWVYDNYEIIRRSQDIEEGFRRKYLYLLADRGLIKKKDRRHFLNEFINDLHNYYGSEFLRMVQSDFSIADLHSWPIKIIRKHEKSFHPVRHLLMMRYLCGDSRNFFKIKWLKLNEIKTEQRFHEHNPVTFRNRKNTGMNG